MPSPRTQNLQNHVQVVPVYHVVLFALLAASLVQSTRALALHPSAPAGYALGRDIALLLTAWFARGFALRLQDRVIRLEMRVRLREIAPAQAQRFAEFTVPQLTALRFAGDDELPALAQQVLDGKLARNSEIKRQIHDWQPDWLRV